MHLNRRFLLLTILTLISVCLRAQMSGMKALSLDDLSMFKPQAGNWMIVGDVTMNPDVAFVHEPPTVVKGTETKKKKGKPELVVAPPQPVSFEPGKGVLLNMNSDTKKDNLITNFDHGDIELELEVMIPKGSNSGIYLQGRYEVQLLDSWGIRNPKFSDIGGIYRNWENEPGKIYMGKAPVTNAAKAAGLWQKMKIAFRAPRFDANGNKIANARFVSVELNGVKIHDNVEAPLPTGGPIMNNEVAMGPLMIQGDHGPVAFRNIRYNLMKELKTTIGEVRYAIFHGDFKNATQYTALKPDVQGSGSTLSCEVMDVEDRYAAVYTGTITVPETDTYDFEVGFTGGARLLVNGQTVIDHQSSDEWRSDHGVIALTKGTYPFEIDNQKSMGWAPPRLSLDVRTSSSYPQRLSAYNSFPPDEDPTSSILIKPGSEPRMLRAFVDFKGDRKQRLTHTIGVGEPTGISYVYDLDAGDLVCVWRGEFVDATPMWHDRGDGSFRPSGVIQYLFLNQPLAFLASPADPFPTTGKTGEFLTEGYTMEESSGRPVYKYRYKGLEVTDKIYPEDENRSIAHEVTLKERGTTPGLQYKLAEGSIIMKMANGTYAVDDKSYYIKVQSGGVPLVREINGKMELVLPFDGTSIRYSIIW